MIKKLLAPLTVTLGFLGVVIIGMFVSAHAAGVVQPDDGSLLDLARPVFDAIMSGHYIASASLALVLVVALIKRYAPGKYGEFVHSDMGGALTTLLISFGGALATATVGGAPWTWGMLWAATGIALTAAGGYSMIKKLVIEPFVKPWAAKAPGWMQPLFALVLWIFDRKFLPADAVKNAEAVGDAAVEANPATGVDTVVGAPKDL